MVCYDMVTEFLRTNVNVEDVAETIFETFSDEENLLKMGQEYSAINSGNRNQVNVTAFSENIMKKENIKVHKYERFLLSKNINGLMYSPTQVGKSMAICDVIRVCLKDNVPVIVSSDNKTDQCEQLYNRMKSELGDTDVKLIKITETNFAKLQKAFKDSNNRVIIFCLDNSSQIEKVISNISQIHSRYEHVRSIKKIALIHDEADTVAKDKQTDISNGDQAVSHQKWIELVNFINNQMSYIDLKRIFVTATPENVCMLYNIESPEVIKLEIPNTYRGYKDIKYNNLEDDLNMRDILKEEIKRIREDGTFEVILYCIDRKIANGQDLVLNDMAKTLKCVVNTYNGNGILTILRDAVSAENFELLLKKSKTSYKRNSKTSFTMKKLPIRKFYTFCKEIGEKCIVTIGKDLIARGISYVGEDAINPLTATTIIYKPGMTMHAVGICQTIGRITGCAMPDLQRRVYAPADVIKTYRVYNENQEKYINRILKESSRTTCQIIQDTEFAHFNRGIDRNKLDLKMKMKKFALKEPENVNELSKDGVNLKKLRKWLNNNSLVGKMVRKLYDIGEMSTDELRISVDYTGTAKEFGHNIDNGRGVKCSYGKLWSSSNGRISLSPSVLKYVAKHMQ